jgi:UDP-glucose 4-epimerase
MTLAWVIGGSGLLGRALCARLSEYDIRQFTQVVPIVWQQSTAVSASIRQNLAAFAQQAGTMNTWQIYWAAGIGTMNSSADALVPEAVAFDALMTCLKDPTLRLPPGGAIALASSAGATYAASQDDLITETTPLAPTTAYARHKLAQEAQLAKLIAQRPECAALVARISTLYGPGQAEAKAQGLLTNFARAIVRNQPVHIYVPLDTIRDYIHTRDATDMMIATLRATPPGECRIKIIASEQAATVAQILAAFRKASARPPKLITSASPMSALYKKKVKFRSVVAPRFNPLVRTSLAIGVAELLEYERRRYTAGSAR